MALGEQATGQTLPKFDSSSSNSLCRLQERIQHQHIPSAPRIQTHHPKVNDPQPRATVKVRLDEEGSHSHDGAGSPQRALLHPREAVQPYRESLRR